MKKKKILCVVLALIMLLALLSACGSKDSGTQESNPPSGANSDPGNSGTPNGGTPNGGGDVEDKYITANIRISSEITNMSPYGSFGAGPNTIRSLLYEPLYYYNRVDKTIEPCIAKSMEKVSDTVYRVEIYDYVTDSLQNNVTADDIIFSFNKAIESGNFTGKVNMIKDMEKVNEYTVDFILEDDPAIGALDVAMTSVWIITEAGWEASGDEMTQNPIGTNCYALTDFISSSYWDFDLRGDYWQTDESLRATCSIGNADHLHCPMVTDTNAAAVALERNEIDTSMIGASARETFMNPDGTIRDGFTMDVISGLCVHMYFTCNEESPTSDVNLRKAIAYSLDRTALGFAYGGEYAPKLNSIYFEDWLDGDYGQDPDAYYNQNYDLAKQYLEQSNYKGETIRVMVVTPMSMIGPLIQAYMTDIGVNCEILNYDRATFSSYANDETYGNFDIVVQNVNANAYSWDAISYLSGDGFKGGVNRLYIHDEKLDELYQNAKLESRYTGNSVKALADYVQEQCYAIGLYSTNYTYFSNANVIQSLAFGSLGDVAPGPTIYN